MSREYLLKIDFEKHYKKKELRDFFIKWCGKDQIFKIEPDYVVVEMGCSSGLDADEYMQELYTQLQEQGFKLEKEDMLCWSLHPDRAISLAE